MLPRPQERMPLYHLRQASRLSAQKVVDAARRICPDFPSSRVGYLGIENGGTRDWWYIHALAAVFGVDPARMAEMVKPAERQRRGPKPRPKTEAETYKTP